jgi:hypothetical protein
MLTTSQLERCHELARRALEDKQKLIQLYRPVFVILNNDFLEHGQRRKGFLPWPVVVSLEGHSFYTHTPTQNPNFLVVDSKMWRTLVKNEKRPFLVIFHFRIVQKSRPYFSHVFGVPSDQAAGIKISVTAIAVSENFIPENEAKTKSRPGYGCLCLLWINKVKTKDKMYMSVGVMKDYKLKLWKLLASHTLGWLWNWNT